MDFPSPPTSRAALTSSHLPAQAWPSWPVSAKQDQNQNIPLFVWSGGHRLHTTLEYFFYYPKNPLHYHQVMIFVQTEESSFLTHLHTTKMPHWQYRVICMAMGKIKCFLCSSGGLFPVQLSPGFMCLLGRFCLHKYSFADSSSPFGSEKVVLLFCYLDGSLEVVLVYWGRWETWTSQLKFLRYFIVSWFASKGEQVVVSSRK